MAFTLESAGRVRSKANEFSKSPAILLSLKSLFLFLSMYKKGQDLAILPFSGASTSGSGGQVLGAGTATIFAVYAKGAPAASAANYLAIFDDATDDSGGATDARLSVVIPAADNEVFITYPSGVAVADGIVAKSYTDFDGTTDDAAGDSANGFIIIGA